MRNITRLLILFVLFGSGLVSVAQTKSFFELEYEKNLNNDKLGKALDATSEKQVVDAISFYENAPSNFTVNVKANEILFLKALNAPSSGYTWLVEGNNGKVVELIAQDIEPAITGEMANQRIVLKPIAKGTTVLTLKYVRPWENVAPVKEIKIQVSSQGAYSGPFEFTPEVQPMEKVELKRSEYEFKALPSSFDWRNNNGKNIMTSIKNQGTSNGCWSFGALASFEALVKDKTGIERDYSEQWMCNCNSYGFSCSGGGWFAAQMFIDFGAVAEADEPFMSTDGVCEGPYNYLEKATAWGYTDGIADDPKPAKTHNATIAQIKQAIYDHGPVAANTYTSGSSTGWSGYTGGVYNPTGIDNAGGHIICIVGWDDANQCWIVKNSWGSTFGENGYIRIKYGVGTIGAYSIWIDAANVTVPVTDFTANKQVLTPGTSVSFTSKVNGSSFNYAWTFEGGNPATSTSANPTVTYSTAGKYNVTLKTTNSYGSDTETKFNYISVNSYCVSTGKEFSGEDYIKNVNIASINKSSSKDRYSDFTQAVAEVEKGKSYPIKVTLNKVFTEDKGYVWVDWDRNNSFSSNELVSLPAFNTTSLDASANINVPSSAATGDYRMRVRLIWDNNSTGTQPCGDYYGEVEDYTIRVVNTGELYCVATGKAGSGQDYISNVTIGSINNTTGKDSYANYTEQSTTVQKGSSYNLSVSLFNKFAEDKIYAWADWNNDRTFSSNELVTMSALNTNNVSSGTVTVPSSAVSGNVRLRARVIWDNSSIGAQACGDQYGDVEDYTLTVGGGTTNPVLTSIVVSPSNTSIALNGTQQFTAQGKDQNGNNMSANVTWTTTGGNINSSGLFTGNSNGTFTVTATSGSIKGTAAVTVSQVTPVLTTVVVSPSSASIAKGATQQFTAQGKDQNGNNMNATFNWSASGGSITSSGLFTGSTAGTFTVTATSGSKSGTATVTVTDGGGTVEYCAASHTSVLTYFYISNVKFGTINNTTTLGNSSTGYSNHISVSTSLNTGSIETLSVSFAPGWSGNKGAVYIDWNQDGDFDDSGEQVLNRSGATSPYTASVTVPSGAKSGTTRMRVRLTYNSTMAPCGAIRYGETEDYTINVGGTSTPVLTTIAVSPSTTSVALNGTQQFTAQGKDQNGNNMAANVTWTTTGGSITSSGFFTGNSTGTFTVRATSGSISGNASVTVTAANPVLTSIVVSPSTASIALNGTQQFTAQGKDQNGNNMSASITWSTTGGSINSSGLFTGSTTGTFTVRATSGSVSGTASVTVQNTNPTDYCAASHTSILSYFFISNVSFGTINNTTTLGNSSTAYTDYTNLSTSLSAGSTQTLSVSFTPNWSANKGAAYIDWNGDGDFDDSGELVLNRSGATSPYTASVTAPAGATGSFRMRVRLTYNSSMAPCGAIRYGETEDYTINIGSGASNPENPLASNIESSFTESNVFPNPNKGSFKVSVTSDHTGTTILRVIGLNGQVLAEKAYEKSFETIEIPMDLNLSPGIYNLQIIDGNNINNRRLIIQ